MGFFFDVHLHILNQKDIPLLCRINNKLKLMFPIKKSNKPPTAFKSGERPDIFKFILGSAVFVVGFLIPLKNAEPREKRKAIC